MVERKYDLEASLKREADEETKKLFQPKDEEKERKIQELRRQYQIFMAEYERLDDEGADDEVLDKVLKPANEIFSQLNEIDPRIRGKSALTLEESEFESALRKYKLDHPKDLN